MPPGTRAELIDGVVYMPSPVGSEHGLAHVPVIVWLDYYAEQTPGLQVLDNATTILGWRSEPQPDGCFGSCPNAAAGHGTRTGSSHGAPELVAEVSKATRYVDLGPKLTEYERAGVLEYHCTLDRSDEIFWFVGTGRAGRVDRADGLYRSAVFPGLWLDPNASEGRPASASRRGRPGLRHARTRRVRRAAGRRPKVVVTRPVAATEAASPDTGSPIQDVGEPTPRFWSSESPLMRGRVRRRFGRPVTLR